jgi:hypothetical protein
LAYDYWGFLPVRAEFGGPPFRRSVEPIAAIPCNDEGHHHGHAERALPRNYDLIVYGASGFTGRLVAEHLLGTYGRDGRNQVDDGRAKHWEAR